ncbi:MAG: hypothetical protein IKX09_02280 [Oscillospiraceae bacterium]|nr:hypothetical protein [Oscillospiraceae bacterium]
MKIKKILSVLLCLVIMACMCMPVMAEDETPPAQKQTTEQGSAENGEAGGAQQESQSDPAAEPEPSADPEPEPEPENPPVRDPIRMSVADTPQVKAGESVKFDVEFTAETGYTIDSVEMVTSTDINTFPFNIDLSNYKVFYGADKAVYPFDLTARTEANEGYYKIPVNVNYTGSGIADTVQFLIPVYVTAEKKEEPEPEPIEPPVQDPVKMSVSDTPTVKAGESVKFDVEFTAEEGFIIDSVEMVTSTDINTFPFSIDLSNYKVFYGKDKAVYPFDLKARSESNEGYYKIPVNVNYTWSGTAGTVQFLIPVYVTAEKKEEEPEPQPDTRPLPKMIVSAVSTDPPEIEPGYDFVLSLTVKNTSGNAAVKNMEITVTPQGGAFSSTSGTTSTFVSYLGAGCSKTISMGMTPKDGLAPGVYNIDVRMVYDTTVNNASSSANETITVTVAQAPQARIAAIDVNPYGEAYVGESISLKSAVYNVGKSTLYNVFATFSCAEGIISSKEVFLGNIEAGGTGEISAYVSALNIGKTSIKLTVRYEDSSGKTYTLEGDAQYQISEKQQNSSDILPEPEDDNGNILKWVWIGITAAAAAAGGYVVYRRRKGMAAEDTEE